MSIAPDGYPTVQAQSMYMSKSRGSEYGRTISGSASGSSAGASAAAGASATAGASSASPSASAACSPSASAAGSPSSPSSAGGASGASSGAAGASSASASGCSAASPAAPGSSALPSASAPSASRSASSGSGHTSPAATVSATLRSTHFSQTRLLDKSSGTGQYTNRLTSFMKPLWSFLTHRYGSEEHPTIITRSPFFMPLTSFSRSFLIRLNSSLLLYSLSFFLSERKTFSSSSM
mmetsp:Transcript_10472/g.45501  ORF Transcript_10472/g.45501 Transcript_10472/m.45501 type:complete len:236 (-) Transcript_10472:488-1195(-)